MATGLSTAVIVLIFGVVFFFIARRVLRLALKLAFAGMLIIMLVAGGGISWWRGWFSSETKPQRPTSQTNQRSTSNRRPSSR